MTQVSPGYDQVISNTHHSRILNSNFKKLTRSLHFQTLLPCFHFLLAKILTLLEPLLYLHCRQQDISDLYKLCKVCIFVWCTVVSGYFA